MDKIKLQEAKATGLVAWPSKEHVVALADSIECKAEVDMRDRALISFLLLSGMRDMAVASLPLGCFDPNKLEVRQYPELGVQTKFHKKLITHLFVFDDRLLSHVLDWAKYLTDEKGFSSKDPFFPWNKVVRGCQSGNFESTEVEPKFWAGAGPIRRILKDRSEAAGLPYYKPHAFRHAAAQLALRQRTSPEEWRVVSQNLGHESPVTTDTSYAKQSPERVKAVMSSIDFSRARAKLFDDEFKRKLDLLMAQGNKSLDIKDMIYSVI